MPTLRIALFDGRTRHQKAALASEITEACVSVLGGGADGVGGLFFDIARQDRTTGGVLWADKSAPKPQG